MNQMIITIAPGKTLAWLEEKFGKPVKIVRTMPNTPAMVGEGMTAACRNTYVTEEDMDRAVALLKGFGPRGDRAGTADGRSGIHKRKLPGICI